MNMFDKIENIKSREDLIDFIDDLVKDTEVHSEEWENKSISDYLLSMQSWIEDMDGFYLNNNLEFPKNIDWSFIATIMYIGRIYE